MFFAHSYRRGSVTTSPSKRYRPADDYEHGVHERPEHRPGSRRCDSMSSPSASSSFGTAIPTAGFAQCRQQPTDAARGEPHVGVQNEHCAMRRCGGHSRVDACRVATIAPRFDHSCVGCELLDPSHHPICRCTVDDGQAPIRAVKPRRKRSYQVGDKRFAVEGDHDDGDGVAGHRDEAAPTESDARSTAQSAAGSPSSTICHVAPTDPNRMNVTPAVIGNPPARQTWRGCSPRRRSRPISPGRRAHTAGRARHAAEPRHEHGEGADHQRGHEQPIPLPPSSTSSMRYSLSRIRKYCGTKVNRPRPK